MATGQWAVVLRHVQRVFQGEGVSGLSEGQLLERFASTRDELAFEALLHRHGPMVLGVCRGVLDDPNDVDDAFQATFLVLVKKAAALRDADLLGRWLYGVARKVALRARSDSARRRAREGPGAEPTVAPLATLDAELRELQALIREEVDRLSGRDRMAVVLCYLEGLTHEEAADRLGWPVGTVKSRLSRARETLKARLTRRGVALPTAAIASTLAKGASASVPLELLRSTTLAAGRLASGQTLVAGIVSAHAITLMEGAIGTMSAIKLKIGAGALAAGLAVAVPGVLAYQGAVVADPAAKGPSQGEGAPSARPEAPGRAIGTTKLAEPDPGRGMEIRLAEQALERSRTAVIAPTDPNQARPSARMEQIPVWSRRLLEAKTGPDSTAAGRKAALEGHRDRMQDLVELAVKLVRGESSGLTDLDVLEAKFRLVEARRWVHDGRIAPSAEQPPQRKVARNAVAVFKPLTLKTQPGDEERNKAILEKLEVRLSMNFPDDTPLTDVKKYIETATQDEAVGLPTGVPIYVDPDPLLGAGRTPADTVTINLEGIPLRTTLHLLLHQLGLAYRVEGGLLLITAE